MRKLLKELYGWNKVWKHKNVLTTRSLYTKVENENDVVVKKKMKSIQVIEINRPEKRNCINFETAEKLRKAFNEFENDSTSKIAILHGAGGNFCAGYDLTEVTKENVNKLEELILKEGPMGPTRTLCTKPVIAAIDGYAVAGGLELCLMCDLRVVDETASLGFLNRRFGVPLIDGGTVRLPKLIGLSRAMDLILTGRPISAQEALDWGLANRITACGTALGKAMSLAISIAKFPQECLLADRDSTYHSVYDSNSIEEALQYEATNGSKVLSTESIAGALKFINGAGRGGKSNIGYDDSDF